MESISSLHIQASPEKVWSVLADFNLSEEWNPFIKCIKVEVSVGQVIEAHICPPESNEMTFKPVILAFEKNKGFRWLGKLLFSGTFDGEHRFVLKANEDGSTEFIYAEHFRASIAGWRMRWPTHPLINLSIKVKPEKCLNNWFDYS